MANYVGDYMGSMQFPSSSPTGLYRARVEETLDPLQIGRVRVRVPMFHGTEKNGIPKDDLPWAMPCTQSAGYGYGTFIVPEVGEWVFVTFEDSSTDKPLYLGSTFGTKTTKTKTYGNSKGQGTWSGEVGRNEVPVSAQRVEPTRKILYKSPKGASIEIDEINRVEKLCVTDQLGQMLKFEPNLTRGTKHKRKIKDMDSMTYGETTPFTSGSRVVLRASGEQYYEMTTDGSHRDITMWVEGYKIHIINGPEGVVATYTHRNTSYIRMDDEEVTIYGVHRLNLIGNTTVNIHAYEDVNVQADRDLNAHANRNVNISAGQTVNISAGASINLSAPSISLNGAVVVHGSLTVIGPLIVID